MSEEKSNQLEEVATLNLNKESLKTPTKTIILEDGKIITIKPYLSFQLFIAYTSLEDRYESQEEKFRDLISNGEVIKLLDKDGYEKLTAEELKLIAISFLNSVETTATHDDIYEKLFRKIDQEVESAKQVIMDALKPLQESGAQIIKRMESFRKNINAMISQVSIVASQWNDRINEFISENKEYLDTKDKAALIATKYDWFITYGFYIDSSFLKQIIAIDGNIANSKEMDNLFIQHYDGDRRNDIINDLQQIDVAEEYKNMIDEIKIGYENKLFYLVVPTLFALIEGVLAKGFEHKGYMGGEQYKKYISSLLDSDETKTLQVLIKERMLIGFKHGVKIDSPISRHAILHGGDTEFGNEAVALRLLLIAWNIILMFRFREVMD